jgi:hypothetical protein
MVAQGSLVDNQNPFGESLTVLDHEQILVVGAVKYCDDVLHLPLDLLLVHLFSQLEVAVNRKKLFYRNCHLCF